MTKTRTLPFQRPVMLTALLLIAALLLSACVERRADRIAFDEEFFRATSKKLDKDRINFEVTVRPVSASLEGARDAGRQEATRYCVGNFGSSDIDWIEGPDAEDGRLRVSRDTLRLVGRCKAR
ncbi:MAG: hypothetical protein ABJR46_17910 [Tateyamaria sp.]|uniref:hypothetical protein n=1 Tax=Tateyamaria sp. TaxID=1929288 RepID=UPI00329AF840